MYTYCHFIEPYCVGEYLIDIIPDSEDTDCTSSIAISTEATADKVHKNVCLIC